jgi:hypothetical protein
MSGLVGPGLLYQDKAFFADDTITCLPVLKAIEVLFHMWSMPAPSWEIQTQQ